VPKHGRAMSNPLDIFATNLRRIRQERGLSQERLALTAGLNMTHVAKIERSEREPGVRTVSKLAKTLGVSAAELFGGIDGCTAHEHGHTSFGPTVESASAPVIGCQPLSPRETLRCERKDRMHARRRPVSCEP
jgi:transcriptional regulator with XRE-family HTH domain